MDLKNVYYTFIAYRYSMSKQHPVTVENIVWWFMKILKSGGSWIRVKKFDFSRQISEKFQFFQGRLYKYLNTIQYFFLRK